MVTFLWRLSGKPNPKSMTSTFSDVKKNADNTYPYYYKAVLWAAENSITKGYTEGPLAGKFGVGESVTREDMVTFLYRAAGKPKVTGTTTKFSDVVSGKYYATPIAWAAKNNITKGYNDGEKKGTFGVGEECLREHIVTFMYRYSNNVVNKNNKQIANEFQIEYSGNTSQTEYTYIEYDKNGNKTKSIGASFPYGVHSPSWIHVDSYDKNGNIVKETYFGAEVDGRTDTWEYDAVGNLLKYMSYEDNNGEAIIYLVEEYEYDAAGNCIKKSAYDSYEHYPWYAYEYNAAGQLTKSTTTYPATNASECFVYEYDAKGNNTKVTWHDVYGNIDSWNIFEYDAKGNCTKETRYYAGSVVGSTVYGYDTAGRLIKETRYDENGVADECERIYEYNSKGLLVREAITKNGEGCYHDSPYGGHYTYDANGNMTSRFVGGSWNLIDVISYVYH